MGEHGGDYLVAPVALAVAVVVGPDDRGVGEDGRRPGSRLEAEGVHAGDLAQLLAQLVEDPEQSLDGPRWLIGMDPGHARMASDDIVDDRVVFHRAGTEAHIDIEGRTQGLLGEP